MTDELQLRNKERVLEFYRRFFNEGDVGACVEIVASNAQLRAWGRVAVGPEAFVAGRQGMVESFPDLTVSIEQIVAEGDWVAARVVSRGTHLAAFRGLDATGTKIEMPGATFFRFLDGKVVESYGMPDELALLRQLGLYE